MSNRLLKSLAGQAFRHAGGARMVRWMNRKGLRILMYHRFPQRSGLERQCAHMRACYTPLSMSEAAEAIRSERPLPDNALAVTVDDGYRDFLQAAYPVFRSYSVPVTVYLVSDFVNGHLWLWGDRVQYAFRCSPLARVEVPLPSGEMLPFELNSLAARDAAASQIKERAKLLANAAREVFVESAIRQLKVHVPDRPTEDYQPLSWDEVRSMAGKGVEFGAHTRTHPILSRLGSEEELRGEIAGSRDMIETQLQRPVAHFCYPNGRPQDVGEEALSCVRQAGFATAVTTESGLNHPGDDCLRLRRIAVEPDWEGAYFERCAAAFRV